MNKTFSKLISMLLVCMMLFGAFSGISYAASTDDDSTAITFNVKKASETADSLVVDIELVSGSFVCTEFTLKTSDRLTCTEITMCDSFNEFQAANGGISAESNVLTQKSAIISLTSYSKLGGVVRYSFDKTEAFGTGKDDITLIVTSCYDMVDGEDTEMTVTVTSDFDAGHVHTADGEWITVKQPDCKEEGKKVKYCSVCGEVAETEPISKLAHKEATETVNADCTNDGYVKVYCTVCNEVIKMTTLNKTGHQHTRTVTKDATCTEDGYVKTICTDCGTLVKEEPIKASGSHQNTETVSKAPTCTEDGYSKVVCKDCKETVSETTLPATGHQNTEKQTVLPGCEKDGYVRVVCKDCGETVSETTLPATGHQPVNYKVPATCTEDGYIDRICTSCKKVFSHTVLPATGHDWSEWETVKEPTYKSYGLKTRYCRNCNESQEMQIPMLSVEATGMSISMTNVKMNYKKSTRLYANVLPEEAAYSNEIVWSSSDPSVATVDQDGNVYAAGTGTATITASTTDGKFSADCKVTVEYSFWQIIIVYVLFGWIWY